MLCTDSVRQLCRVAELLRPNKPIRLIVINTEGVSRRDNADPPRGRLERLLLWFLFWLVPPVADNEGVVDFLHREARSNPYVDFCAPCPSSMCDGEPSAYTLHATLQNGIFDAGTTTRANVGAFMADLATQADVWQKWAKSFPHILDVPKPHKVA